MKIQLSKSDSNIQFVILIIAILLLWIPVFIEITPFHAQDNSLFGWCFGWISKIPFIGVLIAFLLVCFNLFILLKLLSDKHLKSVNTIYPAIIYLIFLSNTFTFQLSPELIACSLIITTFSSLFSIEDGDMNDNAIIKSSFVMGIAVLFCPSIWICLLLPIFAVLIFDNLSIRKILLSILGSSLIWIWVLSFLFFNDTINQFWLNLRQNIYFSVSQFVIPNNWFTISSSVIRSVLLLIVIIIVLQRSQNDVVINRRRMIVTIIFLVMLFIGYFNTDDIQLHENLLIFPETLLINYLYERSKRIKMVGFLIIVIFFIHLVSRWMIVF